VDDLRQRRSQWDDSVRGEAMCYSCDYCSFTSVDLPAYISHEKTHSVSGLGQDASSEDRPMEEERNRSLLRDERSRRFTCLVCPESFDDPQHYSEHLFEHRSAKDHINVTGFECCVCRQVNLRISENTCKMIDLTTYLFLRAYYF